MEHAIFISKTRNLKYISPKYKRLYFGNEFCERLIPQVSELKRAIRCCDVNKLDFSLVTSYVTDRGLKNIEKLFAWLQNNRIKCEIIINDYGVLDLMNEKYQTLKPVLGRLLTKQKRDPRIMELIKTEPKEPVFLKRDDEYYFIFPKKIPDILVSYYKETTINVPLIQEFLLSERIKRVELDNLFQGINLKLLKDKLSASLYVPYGYITTTRHCTANPFRKKKRFFCSISSCKKECQKYILKLRNPSMPKVIYKKGNTLFFKNTKIPAERCLKEKGINRLVYQPEIPV